MIGFNEKSVGFDGRQPQERLPGPVRGHVKRTSYWRRYAVDGTSTRLR